MKTRRLASVLTSLAVALSIVSAVPLSVSAEGTSYTAGLTSAIDGTNAVSKNETSLDKYLVMNVNANVPNAVFDFAITKYDGEQAEKAVIVSAENGNLAVINGVTALSGDETLNFKANDLDNTGSVTAGEVRFAPSDETVVETDHAGTGSVVWKDDTIGNEKYAKKKLTLDFSSVQFTEPGVYRYLITESGTNQAITNDFGVSEDNKTYRTLDVYVEDYTEYYNKLDDKTDYTAPNGKELYISGYVLYEGRHDAAPSASATETVGKSDSYTNIYASQNLTFGKIVTGNQGSKDKYFKYTVEIGNIAAENTKMTVDITKADTDVPDSPNAATLADYAGKTNPAELVADTAKTIVTDGYKVEKVTSGEADALTTTYKITAEYYLQHGQYITIQGLPEGADYSVTEDCEDYTSTNGITANLSTLNWEGTADNDALNDDVSGTVVSEDIHTGYTNDRSGVIPTGILTTVAGSAGIVVLGIVGVIVGIIYVKKKKSEEE